jgi:hypothetical protein
MNHWKQVLLPLFFWLTGGMVDYLILPPISAQTLEPAVTVPPAAEQARPGLQPGLTIRPMAGASSMPTPTVFTNVTTTITGLLARATVSRTFHNPGSDRAEGIYVFPLQEYAAVYWHMRISERVRAGIIPERD